MKASFIRTAACAAVALALGSNTIAQDRALERDRNQPSATRIALVIGNGAYSSAPLNNPVNDATDMAAALRLVGFDVDLRINVDQTDMKRAVRAFGDKLRATRGTGLFYFAGHGVQVKGSNYLVPIGATVNTEAEIEYEALDAGFVLAQMESNPLNIVILDACRNNPFARSFRSDTKGLASIDAPKGTLIAYATAPGSVASDGTGRNGLYTQELLKQIKIPGLSIESVFKRVRTSVLSATGDKQTPWESSSLTGNFFFVQRPARPSNGPRQPPAGETARQPQSATAANQFRNANLLLSYSDGGNQIRFILEVLDDFTNDLEGQYPQLDHSGINIDVNANGVKDAMVDIMFGGRGADKLCPAYSTAEFSKSACGAFESTARFRQTFAATRSESRPHPIFTYYIPKAELGGDGREAYMNFYVHSAGTGIQEIPGDRTTRGRFVTVRIPLSKQP